MHLHVILMTRTLPFRDQWLSVLSSKTLLWGEAFILVPPQRNRYRRLKSDPEIRAAPNFRSALQYFRLYLPRHVELIKICRLYANVDLCAERCGLTFNRLYVSAIVKQQVIGCCLSIAPIDFISLVSLFALLREIGCCIGIQTLIATIGRRQH